MTIKERLNDTMKQAMKAREVLRLSVVRMIISSVKNREIDQKRELNDNDLVELLSTLGKQRRESIRLYKEGNRTDLAQKEEAELAVLMEFLPAQMGHEEIDTLVTQIIQDIGAQDLKDMGRIMKALTPLTAGKADGKVVSDIVRSKLP